MKYTCVMRGVDEFLMDPTSDLLAVVDGCRKLLDDNVYEVVGVDRQDEWDAYEINCSVCFVAAQGVYLFVKDKEVDVFLRQLQEELEGDCEDEQ